MKGEQLLADFLPRRPLKRVLDSESLACRDAEATEALMDLGSAGPARSASSAIRAGLRAGVGRGPFPELGSRAIVTGLSSYKSVDLTTSA